ncbi:MULTISPECIES: sensor histidine kinase [unclassified Streptomyces]|uniref:sensor histidine kinase n=1 Tax=unclassified Streptomyces TaxID=2593676 RepID=UPI00093E6CB8|nr:sensor histidine kinase [Streptomyces sp. CB02058]OKI95643.1 ATPase [Streptomyces sp. CB02058]
MSTTWQRRAMSRPRTTEVITLTLLFAVAVCGGLLSHWTMPGPRLLWPAVLLSALACAALTRRHSHPLPVLAVTTLCAVAEGAVGYLMTPLLFSPLLAAQYTTSLRTNRVTAWSCAVVAAAVTVVPGAWHTELHSGWVIGVVNPAAWVLLSAALGSYVRIRREYAASRIEHAAREREEEARHRVVQERMRIARELHDVVAHHLALANAQAGTAAHLARTAPDQAYEILGKLSETTAGALRELKATVGLLRQDSDADDGLAPAPGLEQLPDLVAACAAAGLDVTVTVEGEPRPLTPGLGLTAYRIVQEALTNVTKHAVTRTASVVLSYTPRSLAVTVTNDTASTVPADRPAPGRGFGLLGMSERALAAGGTFHAGARADGGFEVSCTLPLDSHDESAAP